MMTANVIAVVSVLSFNVWGLGPVGPKIISPLKKERMAQICKTFKKAALKAAGSPDGWDVILLQEAWVAADRELLKKCGYPHSVDLDDPTTDLDAGLMILSRYPVLESHRLTFEKVSSQGVLDGEEMVKKSAIFAKIQHPTAGALWVTNTHLVSIYDRANDTYAIARQAQFKEMVDQARKLAQGAPLVLGGDFNFDAQMPIWKWMETYLTANPTIAATAQGCTICPPHIMHDIDEGKVDHLLGFNGLTVNHSAITMKETFWIQNTEIPMSDHYGYQTQFNFK